MIMLMLIDDDDVVVHQNYVVYYASALELLRRARHTSGEWRQRAGRGPGTRSSRGRGGNRSTGSGGLCLAAQLRDEVLRHLLGLDLGEVLPESFWAAFQPPSPPVMSSGLRLSALSAAIV